MRESLITRALADPGRKITLFVTVIVAAAIALLGILTGLGLDFWESSSYWSDPANPTRLELVAALLLLSLLSEASSVSMRFGSSTNSVAHVPFLASIFLLGPAWAALIGGGTFLAIETAVRRKPAIKVAFNTAKEVVAIGGAALVYVALLRSTVTPETFRSWSVILENSGAILAATVVYLVLGHGLVSQAIALAEDVPFSDAWSRIGGPGGTRIMSDIFSSLLAPLLAFLTARFGFIGLMSLVVPLFFLRHMYQINQKLEQVNRDLLDLMVKSIEARDPYTSGHSQRVSRFARLIAREAGLSARQVDHISTAALLHDVGKIYEEFAPLLRKEGKLSPEEFLLMQSHPVRSWELVSTVSDLRGPIEHAVRHHHENYNGSGYPDGLAGEAIPLGARVIMIADTIDAMSTDRPYRRALAFEQVVAELSSYSGQQFDPGLVEVAINSAALRAMLEEHRHATSTGPNSRVASLETAWSKRRAAAGRL